jgi:Dolichyl-phosphate-mannose-protein mannosyltransferase
VSEGTTVDEARRPAWDDWKRCGRPALIALGALVAAGIGLRILAGVAWWPIISILADSWPYSVYAAGDPFANPQHPAGYSLFLKAIGVVTREVAVYGIMQALLGVLSGLLLFDGVRRMCGSPWPGVAGAAILLLGADQIFLERAIMSESLFAFTLCATVYATGRAMEQPERWYPWPIAAAVFAAFGGMVKPHGLILLPLIAITLILVRPRPWLPRWRPVAAFVGPVCVLMLAFAMANSISHGSFGIGPTPGWHLYARVAPIADCPQFEPPEGTEAICEKTPLHTREGLNFYLYDEESPAVREFGLFNTEEGRAADDMLGEFAKQVIIHEPRAYLESVWRDIKGYYFPNDWDGPTGNGTSLDGQLQWRRNLWSSLPDRTTEEGMETFFDPFRVHRDHAAVEVLHDYQRVFRFGAVALTISTILILIGLLTGSRRSRLTVLVLGVGGLAMFILPTFGAIYSGRYSVPVAGLVGSAGIVGLISGWGWLRARLGRGGPPASPGRAG